MYHKIWLAISHPGSQNAFKMQPLQTDFLLLVLSIQSILHTAFSRARTGPCLESRSDSTRANRTLLLWLHMCPQPPFSALLLSLSSHQSCCSGGQLLSMNHGFSRLGLYAISSTWTLLICPLLLLPALFSSSSG